jgi:ArsR family transcriptional regulator
MDAHSELFRSLADPTRLRLLNLLAQTGDVCVCELADVLRLPQYTVSRHLQILREVGLVDDQREGKWVYYRIARELKPCHRSLLRAVSQLRSEREDFAEDERRANRRLKLRRGSSCCVGPASGIEPVRRAQSRGCRGAGATSARGTGVFIDAVPAGEGPPGA